jgi:tetratricopeptide (TPR) repeat protein
MTPIGKISRGILLGAALLAGGADLGRSMAAQGTTTQAPKYTLEEYNAFTAANTQAVPEQKIKMLDDFVAKYPKSALLVYVYNAYLTTYTGLKDYPKAIDAVDKLLGLGDPLDPLSQFQAKLARAQDFLAGASMKELNTPQQLNAARESARQALKDIDTLKKPDATSDADWDKVKKQSSGIFTQVIATTSVALKDIPSTVAAYKSMLALDPTDAGTYSRLGVAYLSMAPPQTMDGLWALARSISLKVQNEPQIRAYLRAQVLKYQGNVVQCDNLLDDEVNQIVALAAGSADRPASFTLISGDDITKAQSDTTNFIPYLREGGDHGKLMWLATCGLDYPEIVTKLIALDAPDGGQMVMHTFTGTTPDETKDGTVADMEVKMDGTQPDIKRIQINDELRFGATLKGYDQNPFMLHWEKGKVNPEDIPAETGKKPAPKKKGAGK